MRTGSFLMLNKFILQRTERGKGRDIELRMGLMLQDNAAKRNEQAEVL